MTNKEIFLEQMFANKWLNELTDNEVEHLLDMLATSRGFGYAECKKEYEEKLRWIPTSERTPTATETGDWDGKRSDFVLAKTKNGSHYILRVYEGFSRGEKWVDWADRNDMIHTGIVEWRYFL